jgi:hypothetical protein
MAGLELDLDLGPIEIMAGVRAELAQLNKHNEAAAAHRRREIARSRVPIDVRLNTVGAAPSGGADFVLSIGGPDAGYYWLLQRLVIGGLLFDTTANGDAEVYVTGLSFPLGSSATYAISALGLSDLVDHATTLPSIAFYSPHQVIIQASENLVALIGGGTAAQQYVMSAQVQVFRTLADDSTYTA